MITVTAGTSENIINQFCLLLFCSRSMQVRENKTATGTMKMQTRANNLRHNALRVGQTQKPIFRLEHMFGATIVHLYGYLCCNCTHANETLERRIKDTFRTDGSLFWRLFHAFCTSGYLAVLNKRGLHIESK